MKKTNKYEDIINLPHYQSATRPHMSNYDRAAQFSPFAALKGYDEEIVEAARTTNKKLELNEEQIAELNEKLVTLKSIQKDCPLIKIEYFVPDERKAGGSYITREVKLKKVDEYNRNLIFFDGEVPFENILSIELQ